MTSLSSNHVGSISEIAVEMDLLKRGYNVLTPTVVARYDRVVETDGGRFYRVQIKTARFEPRDGTIKVSYDTPYLPSEVDIIAVYDPTTTNVYYIPITDLPEGAKGFTLRTAKRRSRGGKSGSLNATKYLKFGK